MYRLTSGIGCLAWALLLSSSTIGWSQTLETAVPVPAETLPKVEIGGGTPGTIDSAAVQIPSPSPLGNRRALEALDQRLDVRFVETPLEDALDVIAEVTGVSVRLDRLSLADLGVALDQPIRLHVPKTTKVETILTRMLEPLELTYYVDELGIMVLAMEDEQARLVPRIYRLRTGALGDYTRGVLVNLLPKVVDPSSWRDMGGEGSLLVVENQLVIRQSFTNHRRIERLLTAYLTRITNPGQTPERLAVDPPVDLETLVRLNRPLGEQAPKFVETPLGEVVEALATATETTLHLDASISTLGIGRDFPITASFQEDVTGAMVLRDILTRLELGTIQTGNVVAIVPLDIADEQFSLRYYTVPVATIGRGYTAGGLEHPEAVKLWVDLIERTIAPGTWRLEGGPGYVTLDAATNMLFVRHTEETHREIETLLDELLSPSTPPPTGAQDPAETTPAEPMESAATGGHGFGEEGFAGLPGGFGAEMMDEYGGDGYGMESGYGGEGMGVRYAAMPVGYGGQSTPSSRETWRVLRKTGGQTQSISSDPNLWNELRGAIVDQMPHHPSIRLTHYEERIIATGTPAELQQVKDLLHDLDCEVTVVTSRQLAP